MNLLQWIEIAIVLSMIYLALSLVASGLVEAWASVRRTRAVWLRRGINKMLTGCNNQECEGLAREVLAHPLIDQMGLTERHMRLTWFRHAGPTYLDGQVFALALSATLKKREHADSLHTAVQTLDDAEPVSDVLPALCQESRSEAESLLRIAAWFDASMISVTEWYKKSQTTSLFLVGVILAVITGADSIKIANELYSNAACRTAVADYAENNVGSLNEDNALAFAMNSLQVGSSACNSLFGGLLSFLAPDQGATQTNEGSANAECACANIPWRSSDCGCIEAPKLPAAAPTETNWFAWFIGVLITGFAVSLGAPFWFDGLKRLVRIRMDNRPEPPADGKTNPILQSSSDPQSPTQPAPSLTQFEESMSSDDVKDLQAVLGLRIAELSGRIDVPTRSKVLQWQEDNRMEVNGHLSEAIYRAIMSTS